MLPNCYMPAASPAPADALLPPALPQNLLALVTWPSGRRSYTRWRMYSCCGGRCLRFTARSAACVGPTRVDNRLAGVQGVLHGTMLCVCWPLGSPPRVLTLMHARPKHVLPANRVRAPPCAP